MKIAHVVDSMEVGGAETLVSQMCRLQRDQGHDPSVYSVANLGPIGEQMRNEGFAVEHHVGRHLSDLVRNFYRIFKESHPDVVHLHNPTPTIYAGVAARMAGVPSVVSTRHSLVAAPRKAVQELKYAFAARFCDWIVGICDATANNVRSLHTVPARKIVRVYNGAVSLQHAAKEQWPPKRGFTLVYVGRLAPVKNHALLLNAFRAALSSMPGLRLWMVGDGSEREQLESLAAGLGISAQVTFWGQQLDVAPFFSAADAFIMSSRSEGLPVSLLQAFSLGLPAIVTDVGGMAEVVRMSRAGFTVPVSDPAQMATAILRLASNDSEREQFSTQAEEAFHKHFTLQTMVDAYMDLYRNTVRARPIGLTP
ncbi:MAG: glycosyltransferase [Terracidiphilus sp.]|jgi:glycosyltransferase involved in cell wall biosynthesis